MKIERFKLNMLEISPFFLTAFVQLDYNSSLVITYRTFQGFRKFINNVICFTIAYLIRTREDIKAEFKLPRYMFLPLQYKREHSSLYWDETGDHSLNFIFDIELN